MAKSKKENNETLMETSKKVKTRDLPPETDFTFDPINRCVIRFNSAAVVYVEYDTTVEKVSVMVENEITGTTKSITGTLEEV